MPLFDVAGDAGDAGDEGDAGNEGKVNGKGTSIAGTTFVGFANVVGVSNSNLDEFGGSTGRLAIREFGSAGLCEFRSGNWTFDESSTTGLEFNSKSSKY